MGIDSPASSSASPEASANEKSFDAASLYQKVMNQAVQIKSMPGTEAWMGSSTGVFVASDDQHRCEVAVSGHVTDGEAKNGHSAIRVTTADGYAFSAKQILNDAEHQIRIFELENVSDPQKMCHPATVTDATPKKGDLVLGLSSAMNPVEPRAFIGQVQELTTRSNQTAIPREQLVPLPGENPNRQMYAIFGRGEYGDSGGPKFTANAEMFAIHAASHATESLSENAKYLLEDLAKIRAQRQDGKP
ncbi:MAG TPA: hypothetical protein V6D22_08520 [Candidatus Obscuribacterales bacterium]